MSDNDELKAVRDKLKSLQERIDQLESAIHAQPGEDAQIAITRLLQKDFERACDGYKDEIVELRKKIDELFTAGNVEVERRRRAESSLLLVSSTVQALTKASLSG